MSCSTFYLLVSCQFFVVIFLIVVKFFENLNATVWPLICYSFKFVRTCASLWNFSVCCKPIHWKGRSQRQEFMNSSVIRQKGEFQNGCFKKTKLTFLTPWYAQLTQERCQWSYFVWHRFLFDQEKPLASGMRMNCCEINQVTSKCQTDFPDKLAKNI